MHLNCHVCTAESRYNNPIVETLHKDLFGIQQIPLKYPQSIVFDITKGHFELPLVLATPPKTYTEIATA